MNEEQKNKIRAHINMIAVLEDVQHLYMMELLPVLRHGMKNTLNDTIKHTNRFIKYCDKVFDSKGADDYGIVSDEIKRMLDDRFLQNG